MAEENIEKSDSTSMEGVVLGLGALSETLNKMNVVLGNLEKHYVAAAEDDDMDYDGDDDDGDDDDGGDEGYDEDTLEDDDDVDDEELAKAFLMKRGYSFKGPIKTKQDFSTVKNPVGRPKKTVVIKEDNDDDEDDDDDKKMEKMIASVTKSVIKQLVELNADKEHKVSGGDAWPMSKRPAAEDEEKNVTIRSKTDEVQKPIVASKPLVKHDDVVDETDKEYPVEEDEEKEVPTLKGEVPMSVAKLQKEILDLRKSQDAQIKKGIEKGVDEAFTRYGFRKEQPSAQKVIPALGAESEDQTQTVLRKAERTGSNDVTEELKERSFAEIWSMRLAKEEADKKAQGTISTDEFFGFGNSGKK